VIDSRHFSELQKFDEQEQLFNAWYRAAVIASAAHNAFGGRSSPRDFRPKIRRRLTQREQVNVLIAAAAARQNSRKQHRGRHC